MTIPVWPNQPDAETESPRAVDASPAATEPGASSLLDLMRTLTGSCCCLVGADICVLTVTSPPSLAFDISHVAGGPLPGLANATIAVPLPSGGAVIGRLALISRHRHVMFSDSDRDTARTVAAIVSDAVRLAATTREPHGQAEPGAAPNDLADQIIQRIYDLGIRLRTLTHADGTSATGAPVRRMVGVLDQAVRQLQLTTYETGPVGAGVEVP